MARRARVEVEGGLYHVITRGNDRQNIFHSVDDYLKFLSLVAKEKERSRFFLYAFCLMTNHIHLLIERQAGTIGSIMQRVLTGYSQYYNRKYRRVGHVFQGRHKAILCQSDQYLGELVSYIHLNPVRARMVAFPEDYPYSSHRAYLGIEPEGVVDIDPVMRLFGPIKETARERFREFVALGMQLDYSEEFESPAEGDILGSQEFVDSTIHRIGDVTARRERKPKHDFDAETLIAAIEAVFGLSRDKFCGPVKNSQASTPQTSAAETTQQNKKLSPTQNSLMRKILSKKYIVLISQNRRPDPRFSILFGVWMEISLLLITTFIEFRVSNYVD